VIAGPVRREEIQEKWMKLVKSSAVAFAMSALIAGPVLAQGVSSDPRVRGGMQNGGAMQGGTSGGAEEDLNAQPGMSGEKTGTRIKGAKGTVGNAGSATSKGTAGAAATGTKH
jgi:hypothetical protein